MAKRKRKKKTLTDDITKFTQGGITLGVGSAIAATAQSKTSGISVTPAFATMGSFMRPIGVGIMGKHVLQGVRKLKPKKRNSSDWNKNL